jgi:hypothetical protein
MRSLRAAALCLVLTVSWLAPAAAGPGGACAAAAASPRAALVIGTGSKTLTYCVTLDGSTVSGIHLVQLAGTQYGLQYRLGFGGEAVCQLAGVGPGDGDCFAGYPDFWGYWHGDGGGGWAWAGSGAGSFSVGNGEVEGWTWGPGDTGATHPAPQALGFDDVCAVSPDPTSSPTPGGGTGGGGGGGHEGGSPHQDGGGGTGSDDAASSPTTPAHDAGSSKDERGSRGANDPPGDPTPTPTPAPTSAATSPVTALASGVTEEPSGGIPVGVIVALALVMILAGAGWLNLRRRARSEQRPSGFGEGS